MHAELTAHKLEVQLAPLSRLKRGYNEGGCRRVVVDRPPSWYRTFVNRHPSSRGVRRGGFDSRIRRANVLRLLERLATGLGSISKYRAEIEGIARGRV